MYRMSYYKMALIIRENLESSLMQFRNWLGFFVVVLSLLIQVSLHAQNTQDNNNKLEIRLNKELEDLKQIDTYLDLADNYRSENVLKSEYFAHQALDLSMATNNKKGIAKANLSIGKLFTGSEPDLAEKFLLFSLDIAREIKDSLLIISVYHAIGNTKSFANSNQAIEYFTYSLDYYNRNNHDSLAAGIYNNLGLLLIDQDKDSLMWIYFRKAIRINKRFKNYYWLSINYMNIGLKFEMNGQMDSSAFYLNKSLSITEEHNISVLQPWIYNNLCKLCNQTKKFKEGRQYANSAIEQLKNTNNFRPLRNSYRCLKQQFIEQGIVDSALFYTEKIIQLNDSIYKHDKTLGIDMLEIKDKYERETELNKLNQKKQQLFFILSIIILLIAGLAFYLFHRLNIRKKQLENERLTKEIEMKSREVTYKMLHITNKNQLINKVINTLDKIDKQTVEKNKESHHEIISELNFHKNIDIWESFEKEFIQLQPDFLSGLSKDFPKLTQNEKRLCALLKLNMSSKEIADILHLSNSSIYKARYRLRMKLNLTGSDENLNNLLDKY